MEIAIAASLKFWEYHPGIAPVEPILGFERRELPECHVIGAFDGFFLDI